MQHSTPTPARPAKSCGNCGRSFTYKRKNARYCPDCQGRAVARRRHQIRRFARTNRDPRRYDDTTRPRTLHLAELYLARGVPLHALVLSEHERAVLVAGSAFFPIGLRLEAARGLIERHYRKFKLEELLSEGRHDEEMNLAFAVMESIQAAHRPTDSLSTARGKGRPRKVAWTPAEWSWELLLNDFLPRELGKRVRAHKADPNRAARRLDEPVKEEQWGLDGTREITLADYVATDDDPLEAEDKRPQRFKRGATLRDSKLRWPKDSLGMTAELPAEWGYEKHPLELHLASGKLTNPDVPFTILEAMRLEIEGWQPPLRAYDIEEQSQRAREQKARKEACERRDQAMQTTVAEAISDLQQEVRDGFARLEQKLEPDTGVRELEAYLQGVTDARDYVHEPGEPPHLVRTMSDPRES